MTLRNITAGVNKMIKHLLENQQLYLETQDYYMQSFYTAHIR